MAKHVTLGSDGEIAVVRIDRPPANAMDLELLRELIDVVDELEARDPAAVLLTGRDGFFSAGMDLKAAPQLDLEGQRAAVDAMNRVFLAWYAIERPVVCAVSGHAVGGGMILALCGDYRVGSSEGRLGVTEVRVGIPYPSVAVAVLAAELPAPAARRLGLTARLVEPRQALELGVLDELAAPDAVLPRATEVARDLASMPIAGYRATKRALRTAVIADARRTIDEGSDPLLRELAAAQLLSQHLDRAV